MWHRVTYRFDKIEKEKEESEGFFAKLKRKLIG